MIVVDEILREDDSEFEKLGSLKILERNFLTSKSFWPKD